MPHSFYPEGYRPPGFKPIVIDRKPVLNKEGKKLFQGETFHVIPNEGETERMGKGHGFDVFEKVREYVTDQAGGTLTSIDKASYIVIRHANIEEFAKTFDPDLAKKVIHFDWIMDSLITKKRLSRHHYWGIPREKVVEKKAHPHKLDQRSDDTPSLESPKDPQKRNQLSTHGTLSHDLSNNHNQNEANGSNSPSHFSGSTYHNVTSSSSRRQSDYYRNAPTYNSSNFETRRRVSFHFDERERQAHSFRQVSSCLKGINIFVSGPAVAKSNLERKIHECQGKMVDSIATASLVIFVDPRYLFGLMKGSPGHVIYHRSSFLTDFHQSVHLHKPTLVEGYTHDCHHTRRLLDEKAYSIDKADLEDFQCWVRTKNMNLLRRNPKVFFPHRRNQGDGGVDDRGSKGHGKRDTINDYPTPESPKSLHVREQTMYRPIGNNHQSPSSIAARHAVMQPAESAPQDEKVASIESFLHNIPERFQEYDDDEFDVCCSDAEEEMTVGQCPSDASGKATEIRSEHEVIRTKTQDISMWDDDSEPSLTDEEADPTYIDRKTLPKKRKSNEQGSGTIKPDRKWYKTQHDTVHPADQASFDKLIKILQARMKSGEGIPKGGLRAFAARFQLEAVYRRYSGIIRKEVPGLPTPGSLSKARSVQRAKGREAKMTLFENNMIENSK
ncbi:hypothetical protein I302_108550 [Kwoniella bestiolae CBS 10118]|uniref:BRCT domain-containing protein n=1 Tax=Kwoniella bestiolae CBS 10118 TaxID=1296100 RepID=A0A1B9FVD5_9TREE|nr:hypothetical protein I302_07077 [Kwoniella bestiolae CBS 10118]OCF22737.1 hypothetical protein I302_07077 [Kwoniella bestiolae CBS 10118]